MTGPISVVIPAYNRSQCIARAVESVLAQSLAPSEILIVDDGSSDDLAGALAPFGERVRLIVHKTNMGAAAARNTGVQAAAGDLIAFLDSDDVWKPEKLRMQIAFMQRLGLEACCTGFEVVTPGADGARIAWRPYPETMDLSHFVWGCYTSPGSTLVIRRDVLSEGGAYDTRFARYEDWDLMLRLAQACPKGIGFLNEPLATVYVGSSVASDRWHSSLDLLLAEYDQVLQNQDRRLSRKLRSGVAFNRAAVFAARGQWMGTLKELMRSFLLVPVGNWPVRVIFTEKLRNLRSPSQDV